jgi:hypothetical protein
MKSFWDNLFYDIDECGLSREEFAEKAGEEVRDDLNRIKRAIEEHDGKKALFIIKETSRHY